MAENELHIGVSGTDDIDRVAAALAEANKTLPKQFQKDITEVAKELAEAAKAKALALPAEGDEGTTGLRKRVAQGVNVRQFGNSVRITTSMPEEDEAIIPRGFDTRRGWRHPVFGNKKNWVRQPGGEFSWFMETMQDGRKPIEKSLTGTLEDAVNMIDDAGTL